jgi:hypothetical protein
MTPFMVPTASPTNNKPSLSCSKLMCPCVCPGVWMTRSPRIEAPSAATRASVGPATPAGSCTCWTMTSGKGPASGGDSGNSELIRCLHPCGLNPVLLVAGPR